MEGLVRQRSAAERLGAKAALAALRAEEESEAALARELNETLFEIQSLTPSGGSSNKKNKKKKKKKKKQKQIAPTRFTADDEDGHTGRKGSAADQLVHTRSQIDALTRELSREPAAPVLAGREPATHAALVQTRSQIARLTRELSGSAGGGRGPQARTEDEAIDAQVAVLGKAVYQIRPDGDCLFSAVAHQLRRVDSEGMWSKGGVGKLRSAAASEMRANADDYAPFLTEDLETYATRIEGPTHEWGGHLELRALSEVLRCTIVVHSADELPLRLEPSASMPNGVGAVRDGADPELHISYHRQQYMLGEHYNSVVPAAEAFDGCSPGQGRNEAGWTVA